MSRAVGYNQVDRNISKIGKTKNVESGLREQELTFSNEPPSRKYHGYHHYRLETTVRALVRFSLLLFSVFERSVGPKNRGDGMDTVGGRLE